MGVALTSCTVPGGRQADFELGPDEMEFGVGIHGEPGRRRTKLGSSTRIAEGCWLRLASTSHLRRTQNVFWLLINGFGGTPLMELYLMVNAAPSVLGGRNLRVSRYLTGSFVTSLDMAGCSLTVTSAGRR